MSLLQFLQLQPVDPDDDDSPLDDYAHDETIVLEEQPDEEEQLEAFWNHVSHDIETDPTWFQFDDSE